MAQHGVGLVQGAHLAQHGLFLDDRLVHQMCVHHAAHGLRFLLGLGGVFQQAQGSGQSSHAPHGLAQVFQQFQFFLQLLLGREKLVDRRIQQPYGDRMR